jgi:predicted nucleic acid-binding protein
LRFWDSSAIVPLIVDAPGRAPLLELLESDPVMIVWWGTPVELISAVSRQEREGGLDPAVAAAAVDRVRKLERAWHQVTPSDSVRNRAQRLLRVHPLRAADSLQLAAALNVAGDDVASTRFITLDRRLRDAAQREGLDVSAP